MPCWNDENSARQMREDLEEAIRLGENRRNGVPECRYNFAYNPRITWTEVRGNELF